MGQSVTSLSFWVGLSEPAAKSFSATGRHLPDGARDLHLQRAIERSAERTVGGPVQLLGGLPARKRGYRGQGGAIPESQHAAYGRLCPVCPGSMAALAQADS